MKIRIKGNSLRMRLTRTEVEQFAALGYLEEITQFGSGTLIYALQQKPDGSELTADFANHKITVFVPARMKDEWIATETVGFSSRMDLGNGRQLSLLLEKDWVCLDNTMEDQSDNYPNPNAAC